MPSWRLCGPRRRTPLEARCAGPRMNRGVAVLRSRMLCAPPCRSGRRSVAPARAPDGLHARAQRCGRGAASAQACDHNAPPPQSVTAGASNCRPACGGESARRCPRRATAFERRRSASASIQGLVSHLGRAVCARRAMSAAAAGRPARSARTRSGSAPAPRARACAPAPAWSARSSPAKGEVAERHAARRAGSSKLAHAGRACFAAAGQRPRSPARWLWSCWLVQARVGHFPNGVRVHCASPADGHAPRLDAPNARMHHFRKILHRDAAMRTTFHADDDAAALAQNYAGAGRCDPATGGRS